MEEEQKAINPETIYEQYTQLYNYIQTTFQECLRPFQDRGLTDKLNPVLYFNSRGSQLYAQSTQNKEGYKVWVVPPIEVEKYTTIGELVSPALLDQDNPAIAEDLFSLATSVQEVLNNPSTKFIRLELSLPAEQSTN